MSHVLSCDLNVAANTHLTVMSIRPETGLTNMTSHRTEFIKIKFFWMDLSEHLTNKHLKETLLETAEFIENEISVKYCMSTFLYSLWLRRMKNCS